jgi:hypothetical protein
MLDDNGCCILLFETNRNNGHSMGHWTCLCRTKDDENNDSINFYDSYSYIPDDEKNKIDPIFMDLVGMSRNYLSKLLYDSHQQMDDVIEYNDKKHQRMSPSVAVCGRFVG